MHKEQTQVETVNDDGTCSIHTSMRRGIRSTARDSRYTRTRAQRCTQEQPPRTSSEAECIHGVLAVASSRRLHRRVVHRTHAAARQHRRDARREPRRGVDLGASRCKRLRVCDDVRAADPSVARRGGVQVLQQVRTLARGSEQHEAELRATELRQHLTAEHACARDTR
jgi:hypothetical protein